MDDVAAFRFGLRIAEERRQLMQMAYDLLPPEWRPVIGPTDVEAKDGHVVITERYTLPCAAHLISIDGKLG